MKTSFIVILSFLIIACSLRVFHLQRELKTYDQSLTDLRADAERMNQEVICYRYLLNEYEPAPHAVEDCKGIGVDITPEPTVLDNVWAEANGTTTYRFIGEEPDEQPRSHP